MIYSNLSDSYSQEELERSILGAILTILRVADARKLRPEYFIDTRNQVIFEIMLDLDETQQSVHEGKILEILKHRGVREEGVHYLEQLKRHKTNNGSLKKLAELLTDRYLKRRMRAK